MKQSVARLIGQYGQVLCGDNYVGAKRNEAKTIHDKRDLVRISNHKIRRKLKQELAILIQEL